MPEAWPRIVLHADMDAFYAAIEQLDDPSLRGKAVLVGDRQARGVVLTASYEARPFGVGSALPMAMALRRCPHAVVVSPRFERYVEVSRAIMDVFEDFSPCVEALSLDEAFIDMTGAEHIFGDPREMAKSLKKAVALATGGLTVSVGASCTKYVAKVASDYRKPDGLTIVPHDQAVRFLAPLPVSCLWGAGPKTSARLEALGLRTIADVAAADPRFLESQLGVIGPQLHRLAWAEDPRRVRQAVAGKCVGSDRTLGTDIIERADIELHLRRAADNIGRRLRRREAYASGVRVKLKTRSFRLLSRQAKLPTPTNLAEILFAHGRELLDRFDYDEPFRLVGLAAFDLRSGDEPLQLDLFDSSARQRSLECTIDGLIERFGKTVICRAVDLAAQSSRYAVQTLRPPQGS